MARGRKPKIEVTAQAENLSLHPIETTTDVIQNKTENNVIDELQKDMVSYGVNPFDHSSVYQFDDTYSKAGYYFEQSNFLKNL